MLNGMSTLNPTSVRSEVDRLKGEFERLTSERQLSAEVLALFSGLLLVVELLLAVFLEKRTRKSSKNSGLPPSQTDKDDTAVVGRHGKGPRLDGEGLSNTRTREFTTVAAVETCSGCGEALAEVAVLGHERRTRIDLVFEQVVEHVDAEIKRCPHCATTVKGAFPADLSGPLQYGAGLKAFIVHLLVSQMVALKRVQTLLRSVLGVVVAEVTLLKFVWRLHQALEGWERRAIDTLLAAPAMHVDETGLRVARQQHWIHVYAAEGITLKRLHRRRGKAAMNAIGILPRYGGVMIHDCWSSYLSYDNGRHALCGAHLLRELTFVEQSNGYAWARNMKRLLRETCHTVGQREARCLSEAELAKLQKRYRTLLTRGGKEMPPIPPKPKGQRGRMAKSDAHNLWERLKKYESAVLLFARDPRVPFTNNRAERDLRMAKVKQKVSGCFRTERYAHAYCRISSYLQSMAHQGVNPLVAIQMAFAGKV